jgi:hypothetical protein
VLNDDEVHFVEGLAGNDSFRDATVTFSVCGFGDPAASPRAGFIREKGGFNKKNKLLNVRQRKNLR